MWCYKSKTHFWWCCYVIFNRWRSDTNAINHQIQKMMLNKYYIYVMKNDSIKKFFVIQKTHKNFHFVRFFFQQIFFNQWFLTIQIVKSDSAVSIIFKNIKKNNFSNYFSQYSNFQFFNKFSKMLWRRFCKISIERVCCCSFRCKNETRFSKF